MARGTAVEEHGVCVIDHLSKREILVLGTRSEQPSAGFIAESESVGFRYSMVVGAPHKQNSVSNRCVERKRNVTKNALHWGDNDGMSGARAGASAAVAYNGWGGVGAHGWSI